MGTIRMFAALFTVLIIMVCVVLTILGLLLAALSALWEAGAGGMVAGVLILLCLGFVIQAFINA